MDSLQLLTLYLTLTPKFSGRNAKINLQTTPKLTVVMLISCLLRIQEFSSGGGMGVHVNVVVFLYFFFAFFLVLSLFYRSQVVNFKEKYHFSRFRRRSNSFPGGPPPPPPPQIVPGHWNLANYMFTCKISFKKNMSMDGYIYYRMCMMLLYTNAK